MKFEIGDKIIITVFDPCCRKYRGKTGKITTINRIKRGYSSQWDYEVTFDDGFCYPFSSGEMEKVKTKNQQLVFEFYNDK